ncbi:MAG: DMP19 family protein [Nannocystaceae bacterium]|nr:DMP19 family protein [bacterium]
MMEAELTAEIDGARTRCEVVGFSELSERDQLLVAVGALEADVNNGGFDQFYFNSAGDLWRQAVAGLRVVGAVRMAELVERSSLMFGPAGPLQNRERRQAQLLALTESAEDPDVFSELDREFWSYPDDVSALLRAHLGSG